MTSTHQLRKKFSLLRHEWVEVTLIHFNQLMLTIFISVLQMYNELCNKGFHILFYWIPVHVGINWNEAAAKASKEACTPLNSPVPYSDLKLAVTSSTRKNWQREWDRYSENKLREIKCISIWSTFIPRKVIILTHLRIGHSSLTHR